MQYTAASGKYKHLAGCSQGFHIYLVACYKPGYNSRTMKIAFGPCLVVEDDPNVLEMAEWNQAPQIPDGTKHMAA